MDEDYTCPFSIKAIIPVLYSGDTGSIPVGGSCENCFTFTTNPRFCSLSCSVSWQQKAKPWPIGYCLTCNAVFNKRGQPYKKFCGRSCAASYNNTVFPKKKPSSSQCPSCSSILRPQRKYCSTSCQQDHYYRQRVSKWLAGKDPGYSTIGTVKPFIKRWLREKHHNQCSRCGWNQTSSFTGKVPLEVEHIDGDWTNNTPENLDLLCPNCHSLTSTYRALNVGRGRPWRRSS